MKALIGTLLATGCMATYPTRDDLIHLFEPILEEAVKEYNCTFGIAFKSKNVTAQVTSGYTMPGHETQIHDKWVWGSVTKVVTGSTVLQLVNKGKISLQDKLPHLVDPFFAKVKPFNFSTCEDLWGPEVYNVTVRDLLAMQSGVPDFDTAKGHGTMTDSFRETVYANPHTNFPPYKLFNVPWVHTGSLVMTPGTRTKYSSTNFMLLGLIAAQAYDSNDWDQFDQKVLFPEELKPRFANLSFADYGSPSNYSNINGYDRTTYNGQPGNGGEFQGIKVYNTDGVFSGWTASNIIGSVGEIADLAWSVYGPEYQILDKEYVDMMIPNSSFYGLATFNLSSRTGGLAKEMGYGTAYGHLGATYGYQSIVSYHPELEFSLAIASDIERDSQVCCYELVSYLDKLLVAVSNK